MNHQITKPVLNSIILSMVFASTALCQPNWRGNFEISVRNPSNVTIYVSVSDSIGSVLFGTEAIYPNSSKTYQKLAAGDIATIVANGKSFTERLNNSSLTLIFDGTRLTGGNSNQNGGSGNGNQLSKTKITFFNSSGVTYTVETSGPNYTTNGGTLLSVPPTRYEIPGDGRHRNYSLNIGARLGVTVSGQRYAMTVSGSGNLVIDNNGVSFNGNFLPASNGGTGDGGSHSGGNGLGASQQLLGFKADQAIGGLIVRSVEPGSLAQKMGLQPGDLIKHLNQQPVTNNQQYQNALDRARQNGGKVVLQVLLAGTNRTVPLHTQLSAGPSVIGISGQTKS